MSRKTNKDKSIFKRTKNLFNTTAMTIEDGFDIIGIKTSDMKYSVQIDSEIHHIKENARKITSVAKAQKKAAEKLAKFQKNNSGINIDEMLNNIEEEIEE